MENSVIEEKGNHQEHSASIDINDKMLDRDKMTKRQFHFLWAGIIFQSFTFAFEICLLQGINGYVAAFFIATSFSSVLPTILAILATALVPFYTKVSDVFGRAQSLTFALCSYVVGLIVEGTAKSFLHLAIGQIFYGMGYTGIQTLSQVLIADTTSLADRGIMFSIWDLGSAVHIFVAQALIDPLTLPKEGERPDKWRLGYLVMVITAVIGSICLMAPVWYTQIRAIRSKTVSNQRKTIKWLLTEFDAIGAVLITLGLSLTLLPLVLAKSSVGNWRNPSMIGMLCGGFVFFGILTVWEIKYATKPIMSMKIWTNRTAVGGLLIVFLLKIMGNVNWQYLTAFFVVTRGVTYGDSWMLVRGFQLAWIVFQLFAGILMKRYNKVRLFAWIGIILYIVGVGLMIPARHPEASNFLVVFSQTVAGAGGGMAHMASQVIVTGVVHRNDLATVVGATQILVSFGSAVGNALAGAIWTQYLPTRLKLHITGEYNERLAMNDPIKYIPNLDPVTKGQLIEAYTDSQKLMSIVCCCIAILPLLCACLFQNVDLHQDQRTQDLIALGEERADTDSTTDEKEVADKQ